MSCVESLLADLAKTLEDEGSSDITVLCQDNSIRYQCCQMFVLVLAAVVFYSVVGLFVFPCREICVIIDVFVCLSG